MGFRGFTLSQMITCVLLFIIMGFVPENIFYWADYFILHYVLNSVLLKLRKSNSFAYPDTL